MTSVGDTSVPPQNVRRNGEPSVKSGFEARATCQGKSAIEAGCPWMIRGLRSAACPLATPIASTAAASAAMDVTLPLTAGQCYCDERIEGSRAIQGGNTMDLKSLGSKAKELLDKQIGRAHV